MAIEYLIKKKEQDQTKPKAETPTQVPKTIMELEDRWLISKLAAHYCKYYNIYGEIKSERSITPYTIFT